MDTTRTFLVALASMTLTCMLGCTGGYRVVRTAADVDLGPGRIALVQEAVDDADEAAFASAFAGALDDTLPARFDVGERATARYHLHVRDVQVGDADEGVRARARLALLEADGDPLDVVLVEAVEEDATRAGARAAEHFGRFLSERRQNGW